MMLDPIEAAFLRSIAEERDDTTKRLVFADWLEERGNTARADFIRLQCELASGTLPEERRHALRVRERGLLDAHRQQWCAMIGLPIEDVHFQGGLIARLRLARWEGGRMLGPALAASLTALTELDLSGLQLGDAGIAAFAEQARLPALRKLILSDNGITDAGAAALAAATGLPRLDTVYLFQNPVSTEARAAFGRSHHFRLTNLDVGERAEGYCMSPGETDMARRRYVRTQLLPLVALHFETYERLQSAMLVAGQYWDDQASDAVHGALVVSEWFEPVLEGVHSVVTEPAVDPNLPTTHIPPRHGGGSTSEVSLFDNGVHWNDNGTAIPLWAAFAPEDGNQDYGLSQSYAPAVMFYRHGGYDILPMRRPHLDGVQPEWGA